MASTPMATVDDASGRIAADYLRWVEGTASTCSGAWMWAQPAPENADAAGHAASSDGCKPALNSNASKHAVSILLRRGHRDVVGNKGRATLTSVCVRLPHTPTGERDAAAAVVSTPVLLDSSVTTLSPSPSGKWYVTFRKDAGAGAAGGNGSGGGKVVAEVWSTCAPVAPLRTVYVDQKLHGDVLADGWFGDVAWSPDERYIAYVAEAKAADTSSYFDSVTSSTTSSDADKDSAKKGTDTATAAKPDEQKPAPLKGSQYDWDAPGGSAGAAAGARETWGEKYEGVRQPRIFILDVMAGKVHALAVIDDSVSAGQPLWAPANADGRSVLVYTAWLATPRRLGMIFCYHRPSQLMGVDVTAQLSGESSPNLSHMVLTPHERAVRSPSISPDGRWLVFLRQDGNIGRFTHNYSSDLCRLAWDTGARRLIVGSGDPACVSKPVAVLRSPAGTAVHKVTQRVSNAERTCPGLYTGSLPADCWAADSSSLWLNSEQFSRGVVYQVEVDAEVEPAAPSLIEEDGARSLLPAAADERTGGDSTVFAVVPVPTADYPNRVALLMARDSPTNPQRFGVVVLWDCKRSGAGSADVVWSMSGAACESLAAGGPEWLSPFSTTLDTLRGLRWTRFPVATPDAPVTAELHEVPRAEALIIYPASKDSKLPLMVFPHGGPHSAFTTGYLHAMAFGATQGFAMLLINYRGSMGFGDSAMSSLPGRIGTVDVEDCIEAARAALAIGGNDSFVGRTLPGAWETLYSRYALPDAKLDANRVCIHGGSHGGFLTGHLIARCPDLFKAAAMRNPVCNVSAMVSMSDIPDWCVVEACGADEAHWDSKSIPRLTPTIVARMLEVSPIAYVDTVKTPTLLLLGQKDRRVPWHDGINFYYALKERGVPCRALTYPEDTHALDKPATEGDLWVNVITWFDKFLNAAAPVA